MLEESISQNTAKSDLNKPGKNTLARNNSN